MIGDVRSKASLNATIKSKGIIAGSINSSTVIGDISIGTVQIIRRNYPNYMGRYVAVPSLDVQILPTKNKTLLHDVVVHEIPYTETSNLKGGYTAIIGG